MGVRAKEGKGRGPKVGRKRGRGKRGRGKAGRTKEW